MRRVSRRALVGGIGTLGALCAAEYVWNPSDDEMRQNQQPIATTAPIVRGYQPETTYKHYAVEDYNDLFAAVRAALDDGARTVVLPGAGTFDVTTSIQLGNNQSVLSPGGSSLTVTYSATDGSNAITVDGSFGSIIGGWTFEGQSGANHAIEFTDRKYAPYNITVERMRFVGSWGGSHIHATEQDDNVWSCLFVSNLHEGGTTHHVDFREAGICNAFVGCVFNDIPERSAGVRLAHPANMTALYSCNFGDSPAAGSRGVHVSSAESWGIYNCNFERFEGGNGVGIVIGGDRGWGGGDIVSCEFNTVDRGIRFRSDAESDRYTVDVRGASTWNLSAALIDANGFDGGYVIYDGWESDKIINDTNYRVVGRDWRGNPVLRARGGNGRYVIGVTADGTLETRLRQ